MFWPSLIEPSAERSTAEMWTKTSFEPSAGVMKPKPLAGLNHFTVPVCISVVLQTKRYRSATIALRIELFREGHLVRLGKGGRASWPVGGGSRAYVRAAAVLQAQPSMPSIGAP